MLVYSTELIKTQPIGEGIQLPGQSKMLTISRTTSLPPQVSRLDTDQKLLIDKCDATNRICDLTFRLETQL